MTNLQTLDLAIKDIDVPADRARNFSEEGAQALASIIAAQGLQHPISVRATGDRYQLVSGLHRLRAFEINGEITIPARLSYVKTDDQARLEEVMENLGRNELIALDRCHHLYELKGVWERTHPNFANGGGNQRQKSGGKTIPTEMASEVFGFAAATAEKIGLSKRAINIAVKIWIGLTPATRSRLTGLDIARKQTELKLLSEQKPRVQEQVLDLIADADSGVASVGEALAYLEHGRVAEKAGITFEAADRTFGRLADDVLDLVVAKNSQRLIDALKRVGAL